MKLEIFERLLLLNILPQESDFATLKLLRELRERLSFTEEEHQRYHFRNENGAYKWDQTTPDLREIEIGHTMFTLIREVFKKLDKEKKLTEQHMRLYEEFVLKE